jgi:hypothetical protein
MPRSILDIAFVKEQRRFRFPLPLSPPLQQLQPGCAGVFQSGNIHLMV